MSEIFATDIVVVIMDANQTKITTTMSVDEGGNPFYNIGVMIIQALGNYM